VRRVVEHLADIVEPDERPDFGSLEDRPFERVRVADVERAYSLTGWKPKTPLVEGLKQTVDWYRDNLIKRKNHRMHEH